MIEFIIPHTDIWIAAFDRRSVQSTVVVRFADYVRQRSILLTPWVRTELLARTRDGRHFARLQAVLDGFAETRIDRAIQIQAARHISLNRDHGATPPTLVQALTWAVMERCQARLWTRDRHWLAFAQDRLPCVDDSTAGGK